MLKPIILVVSTIFLLCSCSSIQDPLQNILDSSNPHIKQVMDNPEPFELQILYTEIINEGDSIKFINHEYNLSDDIYYYPASTVKMPVAFLALERINEIRKETGLSLNRKTAIEIDSLRVPQSAVRYDSTSSTKTANIEHYINKIFAVSDNDAYNRLFEILGADYIHQKHVEKGIFKNSRIRHRVGIGGFSPEENRHTPSWRFIEDDKIQYQEEAKYAYINNFPDLLDTQKGVAFAKADSIVKEPFDFSQKNYVSIRDLHESLKRIIYPEEFSPEQQYNLTIDQLEFLKESMSKRPKDHPYLQDQLDEYYDGYVKFFMYGDTKDPIPDHIKIHNKVGYAYGYLTDCAYIQDTKNDIEFFLTATIHVNANQTYNDGVYEYDSIGIPFLAELGRQVYEYELSNK